MLRIVEEITVRAGRRQHFDSDGLRGLATELIFG